MPQPGLCACCWLTLAKPLPLGASGSSSVRGGFGLSDLMSGLMLCGVVYDPPVPPPFPSLLPMVG